MQKLIRIKTANEALYIGRRLPKKPGKRKKRKNRSIFILTRQKHKNYSYCCMAKNDQNKRKFIIKANIKKTKKKQDKIGRKEQIIYG